MIREAIRFKAESLLHWIFSNWHFLKNKSLMFSVNINRLLAECMIYLCKIDINSKIAMF